MSTHAMHRGFAHLEQLSEADRAREQEIREALIKGRSAQAVEAIERYLGLAA